MVLGRHRDDAHGGDEVLRLLERVADRRRLAGASAPHRVDEQGDAVMGVAAEGVHRLAGRFLDDLRVFLQERLLRVAVGQLVGDEQRRAGDQHAFGGRTGQVEIALRRGAVALVERDVEAELGEVAGDDGRALADIGVQHRVEPLDGADRRQLGRHVAVARAVAFLGDDLDVVVAGDLVAALDHRHGIAALAGDDGDAVVAARLHVGEDLGAGHAVGVRRLEHPLVDRLDDLDAARKRDERDLGILEDGDHGHGVAGARAADHGHDLVFLDEAGGEGARRARVAGVIVDDEADLLAVHAAGLVDALDVELERLALGLAEEGRRPGGRQDAADEDLAPRRRRHRELCKRRRAGQDCEFLHESVSSQRSPATTHAAADPIDARPERPCAPVLVPTMARERHRREDKRILSKSHFRSFAMARQPAPEINPVRPETQFHVR